MYFKKLLMFSLIWSINFISILQANFLHEIVQNAENLELIQSLVDQGQLNINEPDEVGKTPLFYAIENNTDPSIALFLIENGADVNAQDNFGTTIFLTVINNITNPIVLSKLITKMNRHGLDFSNAVPNFRERRMELPTQFITRTPVAKQIPLAKQTLTSEPQNLTEEDVCMICLDPVTTPGKEISQTDCCRHFLCKNCEKGLQRSGRTIACPNCRQRNPFSVHPLAITHNPETDTYQGTITGESHNV